MSIPEYFELPGGARMPRVGFGTWQAKFNECEDAVTSALEAGYRHFDSARVYQNEPAVGRALRRWMEAGGRREELFVVTKLPNTGNRPDVVQDFFNSSLNDLKLDYVDLYMLHTPFALEFDKVDPEPKNEDGTMKVDLTTNLVDTWKAIIKLKETGKVLNVGVCNLNEEQLTRLSAIEKPACLQIEVHVLCQQTGLIETAKKLGIPVVAYSPLGSKGLADLLEAKTGKHYPNLLQLPPVVKIAKAHGCTPAQVLLRQLLQRGLAVIPKSIDSVRIQQNFQIWDFNLSDSEMQELAALDRGEDGRVCDFSFFPGVEKHPDFPFKNRI